MCVIAGGVESMSNVEYYTTDMRWGTRAGRVKMHDRLERGPRTLAARVTLRPHLRHDRDGGESREAVRHIARTGGRVRGSQPAAGGAQLGQTGRFADEIVPLRVAQKKGEAITVERDEGVRPDTTAQSLAALRPSAEGRHGDGRKFQSAERCGGLLSGGGGRSARQTESRTARISRRVGGRRLRARDHGYRAGPGGGEAVPPYRAVLRPRWISSS